jgi:hypothetical protein
VNLLKHIIWAIVALLIAAFAGIMLGTEAQAQMIVGILGGIGSFGLAALFLFFVFGGF